MKQLLANSQRHLLPHSHLQLLSEEAPSALRAEAAHLAPLPAALLPEAALSAPLPATLLREASPSAPLPATLLPEGFFCSEGVKQTLQERE